MLCLSAFELYSRWVPLLKAHNYHIGPDFSNRKRFIIQCYNLLCKGSACFDRRGY